MAKQEEEKRELEMKKMVEAKRREKQEVGFYYRAKIYLLLFIYDNFTRFS